MPEGSGRVHFVVVLHGTCTEWSPGGDTDQLKELITPRTLRYRGKAGSQTQLDFFFFLKEKGAFLEMDKWNLRFYMPFPGVSIQ